MIRVVIKLDEEEKLVSFIFEAILGNSFFSLKISCNEWLKSIRLQLTHDIY